jgi:eukaryotic-like serine/threonine-protein kinase
MRRRTKPTLQPVVGVGTVLGGRYRIEQLIGEGGMGRVYLAEHLRLHRKVAIKVLAVDRAAPGSEQRFIQEARAMAQIGHPNIVDVMDFGETDEGAAYIVMEYLEGEDLRTIMARDGPQSATRVRDIVAQMCRALQAAHEHGVVHRDIKPENCFLVHHGEDRQFVKLLDFGIAKLLERGDRSFTAEGVLVGTPEYMSPEQARGVAIDHRVDIYAVGMVAYELLTGDVAFTGDSYMGVLLQQINDEIAPPSSRQPGIPAELEAIVMKALARAREDRWATMRDMADALVAIPSAVPRPAIQRETLVVEARVPARSRSRGVIAAVAAIAAIAAATWQLAGTTRPQSALTRAFVEAVILVPPTARVTEAPPLVADVPSPIAPATVATPPSETRTRSAPPSRPRAQIDAAMREVTAVAKLCIGSIGGGHRGDRVRVRMTIDERGAIVRARAQGDHAGTKLGACVERAAAAAKLPSGERARVDHVFVL